MPGIGTLFRQRSERNLINRRRWALSISVFSNRAEGKWEIHLIKTVRRSGKSPSQAQGGWMMRWVVRIKTSNRQQRQLEEEEEEEDLAKP